MEKRLKLQFIAINRRLFLTVKEKRNISINGRSVVCDRDASVIFSNRIQLGAKNTSDHCYCDSRGEATQSIEDLIKRITAEIFPHNKKTVDDLKDGDMCCVKDFLQIHWGAPAVFICKARGKYIVENDDTTRAVYFWDQCKPINDAPVKFTRKDHDIDGTIIVECEWVQ